MNWSALVPIVAGLVAAIAIYIVVGTWLSIMAGNVSSWLERKGVRESNVALWPSRRWSAAWSLMAL